MSYIIATKFYKLIKGTNYEQCHDQITQSEKLVQPQTRKLNCNLLNTLNKAQLSMTHPIIPFTPSCSINKEEIDGTIKNRIKDIQVSKTDLKTMTTTTELSNILDKY